MKKFTFTLRTCFLTFAFLIAVMAGTSQTLGFSITPQTSTVCTSSSILTNNYLNCVLTSTVSGATYYTFTLSAGCSIFSILWSGGTATVGMWCTTPGTHTVTGLAYASNSSSIILGTATQTIQALNGPTLSVAGPTMVCPNSVNTYTASGAASYIWNGNNGTNTYSLTGAVASLSVGSAGGSYIIIATGTNGCVSTATNNVLISAGSISVSNPTVCAGGSTTLTAFGGISYTWQPGNISGPTVIYTPTANTTYSLIAANASCTTTSTQFVAVALPPVLNSLPNNPTICQGLGTFLVAGGATNYIWMPGSLIGPSVTVSPSITTCYTVTGSNGPNCSTSSVVCVNVNPSPTMAVSGASIICANSSHGYSVSGNALNYTFVATGNTNVVGTTAVLNMAINSLTVMGHGSNGCVTNFVYPITYLPSPNITVVGSSAIGTLVCEGSSLVYTASGANTYTWSNSSNSNTMSIIAGSFVNYSAMVFTVLGTNTSNGCIGSKTVSPWIQTATCSIVWPGDANRDGVVSTADVLELGLQASSTGNTRSGANISWTGQYVTNWTGTLSTGWNKSHADCNGDGVVNSSDNAAVTANFALTHAFKENGSTAANGDIKLVPAQILAYAGIWNKVDIILGDAANTISQLYGLAFDINYDQSLVVPDSVKIMYTASFLNSANQNIDFQKPIHTNGKEYAASVRVDHTNVSGNGKIGEFWYKLKTGIPENSNINLSTSAAQKVSSGAVFSPLSSEPAISVAISDNLTGLSQNGNLEAALNVYPNPSNGFVYLSTELPLTISYSIMDITGRVVVVGEFNGSKKLELGNISSGTYVLQMAAGKTKIFKKLIVEQ